MQLRSFPSIDQFRHVVADVEHKATYVGKDVNDKPVYDKSRQRPTLTFRGTTKLHGSNLAIRFELRGAFEGAYAQSKERFLSPASPHAPDSDNFGFAAWMFGAGQAQVARLKAAVDALISRNAHLDVVTAHVYGELCGPVVNGKTAIGQLPQRWMLLRVLLTTSAGVEHWLPIEALGLEYAKVCAAAGVELSSEQIAAITDFPTFLINIDFSNPESALEHLETLTLSVEECCPVAAALGKSGLGEGIVWSCTDPAWGRLEFKTKGTKHKGTRSQRLVDIAPEVLASRQEFVNAVLTESRLEQGFDLLRAQHGKVTLDHMGPFLKWVGMDVMKEEADTLEASGLDRKDVMGLVNRQAKEWVMPRLAQV